MYHKQSGNSFMNLTKTNDKMLKEWDKEDDSCMHRNIQYAMDSANSRINCQKDKHNSKHFRIATNAIRKCIVCFFGRRSYTRQQQLALTKRWGILGQHSSDERGRNLLDCRPLGSVAKCSVRRGIEKNKTNGAYRNYSVKHIDNKQRKTNSHFHLHSDR